MRREFSLVCSFIAVTADQRVAFWLCLDVEKAASQTTTATKASRADVAKT